MISLLRVLLSILPVTMLFFSNLSYGSVNSFSPIMICGERAVVVDVKTIPILGGRGGIVVGYRDEYQVVLNNDRILRYFVSAGAIPSNAWEINSKGEFITGLAPDPESAGNFYGVFGAGRTVTVRRLGFDVEFVVYAPRYEGGRKIADFTFRDCRFGLQE